MPQQVTRLGIAFAVLAVVFVAVRQSLVPDTFGDAGHYRAAAVDSIAAYPLKYAGREACTMCHGPIAQKRSASNHSGVSCEVCHGPAAEHVAALLGSGVSRQDVGEGLSLAAVRLLLHDPGRSSGEAGKPAGSVHGASVGLHAADSANAWRGIADATDASNANACLVTAAWHAAGQSGRMDKSQPHHAGLRETAQKVAPDKLLGAIKEALRGGDQRMSCALTERYGQLNRDPETLVSMLIEPAIQFDGALHHEKYFHTATVEFARTSPASRWAHLVALTRVMASGYGFEDQGLDLSRRILGVPSGV